MDKGYYPTMNELEQLAARLSEAGYPDCANIVVGYANHPDDDTTKNRIRLLAKTLVAVVAPKPYQTKPFDASSLISSVKTKALLLIRAAGPMGMTADAVELTLGLSHQSVSARIRELVIEGKIQIALARRITSNGRSARVYVAA